MPVTRSIRISVCVALAVSWLSAEWAHATKVRPPKSLARKQVRVGDRLYVVADSAHARARLARIALGARELKEHCAGDPLLRRLYGGLALVAERTVHAIDSGAQPLTLGRQRTLERLAIWAPSSESAMLLELMPVYRPKFGPAYRILTRSETEAGEFVRAPAIDVSTRYFRIGEEESPALAHWLGPAAPMPPSGSVVRVEVDHRQVGSGPAVTISYSGRGFPNFL